MARVLNGTVVSLSMVNTAVVEVTWRKPHPMYKKLLKRSRKYKADINGQEVALGDQVKMLETRPMSKDKYFKITEVTKKEVTA